MKILIMKITLRAPWVHSLKEKRMIVRSLIQKLKNKFNISVAEVENQDIHSTIDIGIAGLAGNSAQADSIMEHIITFVENNTDAEIVQIEKDEDIFLKIIPPFYLLFLINYSKTQCQIFTYNNALRIFSMANFISLYNWHTLVIYYTCNNINYCW